MGYLDDLYNIAEASKITGLSEMTIRKYLGLTKPPKPSRLPNARKILREGDTQETWAIPLSDLHNAGLMSKKPKAQPAPEATIEAPAEPAESLALLKLENQALKTQIELLERNLGDLRLLLGRSIESDSQKKTRLGLFRRK